MQANALADIEINYEIERIRAWRFRKVSEYMRRLNKEALYSATACRERYNALIDGTARIPTEIDDDPETRRMELENYRQSREQARNKEREENDAKEALERKAKDEARTRNAQKAEELAYKRQQKEQEKAQRAMQRAAAAQVRSQRAGENATAKAQRNAQLKKQKMLAEKNPSQDISKATTSTQTSTPNGTLLLTIAEVNADTPDPRSYLSLRDISKMCADRGIQTVGKDKAQLLSDLQDADSEWTQQDLKKMCHSKGLNSSGSKLSMRYHLALAAAQVCNSFRAGVDATATKTRDETVVAQKQ
jgi:flagellar biosynthesis GTPase FlhF